MPDRVEYRAFITTYNEITNKLLTPASVLPNSTPGTKPIEVTALWDTGAVMTCMKPWLKDRLSLWLSEIPALLTGIGGKVKALMTFINIRLADNLEVEDCPVFIADFPGDADLLIGMDIIGMGDFAVCNTGGKTSFSFAVPPFPDRINFIDKANTANSNNL